MDADDLPCAHEANKGGIQTAIGTYNHMNFHLSSYCNFNLFPTESHAVFINCLDPGGSQFSIVFLLIDLLQCSFRRLLRICRDHPAVMS